MVCLASGIPFMSFIMCVVYFVPVYNSPLAICLRCDCRVVGMGFGMLYWTGDGGRWILADKVAVCCSCCLMPGIVFLLVLLL